MKKKNLFFNLLVLFASILITFLIAEIVFRSLLFSGLSVMQKLRVEHLYADGGDMWNLRYFFGGKAYIRPYPVHPLLGWVSKKVSPDTYEHISSGEIIGRIPVLLYGDSFARGI